MTEEKSKGPEMVTCKICEEEMPAHQLERHLWETHLMILQEYEGWTPGRRRQRRLTDAVEVGQVKRIHEPEPEPEPEPRPGPIYEVRLADVDSNPNFESVQGRHGSVTYNLSKKDWTPIRPGDVAYIVGDEENGIPSTYPYLKFEVRKIKKGKGKGKKKEE
jgi:hypothetical protein